MMKNIKTFRKGAKVRYTGNDQRIAEVWRNSIQTVVQKSGNMVSGYFPMKYADGKIRSCRYAMPISDLEIVTK